MRRAGDGPLARAAETAYQNAATTVSELNAKIADAETQTVDAQAQTAAEARKELPTAQAALNATQADQAQQISAFNTQNKSNAGLLTRLQALNQATAGNSTLSAARWLLFALFVIIELLPVMIKTMLNLGPESTYDRLLKEEERRQLRVAEHNRALRQRTQMMEAEAEQAAAQAMLTAWEAERQEITQEIIAARVRVEAKWVKAWEDDQIQRIAKGQATAPYNPPAAEQRESFLSWPRITRSPEKSRRRWRLFSQRRQAQDSQPYNAPFSPGTPGGEEARRPSAEAEQAGHGES